MKIAVSAKAEGLNAKIDDRFGRAEYYVIFDTETKEVKTVENSAKNESAGAGGKAVKVLGDENVNVILAPEVGPKAITALKAFEIEAYLYAGLGLNTVEEAIDAFNDGKLAKANNATVEEHSGLRKA
ncbi:MAG: hypothetical protein PWP46_918 [Fusobacteriaceae bacterium]|jgi:predicted Fe-Mo cluster-binding NifX family protein|nr:Dinitrogenase iron-molybdenum cofactor biosynthesis protein [Fusobacteriales bacterium]MDN5304039.1 hypothetical protein [Fusobacteriaceae bacterium]